MWSEKQNDLELCRANLDTVLFLQTCASNSNWFLNSFCQFTMSLQNNSLCVAH